MSALARLLRLMFKLEPDLDVELVMVGIAAAALALGIFAWLGLALSLYACLGVVGGSFVLLLLCLTHRFTAWLPALLGALLIAIMPTLLGMVLGEKVHAEYGMWPGGAVGLALGVWPALASYRKVVRTVLRPERKTDPS